jgi:replication factor C subunit 1
LCDGYQGVNGKLSNIIRELSTNTAMGVGGSCGGRGGRKTVIVMDEVDGMSGSDRGGISDLIKIIAKSKVVALIITQLKGERTLIPPCHGWQRMHRTSW